MITQKEYNSIEQYLNGQLNDHELQTFLQRLATDEPFAEAVFLQDQIQSELTDTRFQNFKTTMTAVEAAYHTKIDEAALLMDESEEEGLYTLEELLEMFQPVNHYEKAISEAEFAGVVRAGGMDIITPDNGADCSQSITFQLINPVSTPIKIVIENSEEDIVKRAKIEAGATQLTVDTSDLLPGRYYWKLKSKVHGTMLGMFFVQKGLMPQRS